MKPGTIVLSRVSGLPGKALWMLQALNGDLSEWTHAGIVAGTNMGDVMIFEARAEGAGWAYVHPDKMSEWVEVPVELTDAQRNRIVQECHRRVGTQYNWSTYFYLAAYRLRLPLVTRLLRARVARSNKMICSQMVDDIYRVSGVHLFKDGRLPYDVTPGDLARLIPE